MKTKTKTLPPNLKVLTPAEFWSKLPAFITRLETEKNARLSAQFGEDRGPGLQCKIEYEDGRRFVRVVDNNGSQRSVTYFVEKETGVIFGHKSWLQYNPNQEYGTLDTLDEYEWGNYYAARKDGKSTLVPKDKRR